MSQADPMDLTHASDALPVLLQLDGPLCQIAAGTEGQSVGFPARPMVATYLCARHHCPAFRATSICSLSEAPLTQYTRSAAGLALAVN